MRRCSHRSASLRLPPKGGQRRPNIGSSWADGIVHWHPGRSPSLDQPEWTWLSSFSDCSKLARSRRGRRQCWGRAILGQRAIDDDRGRAALLFRASPATARSSLGTVPGPGDGVNRCGFDINRVTALGRQADAFQPGRYILGGRWSPFDGPAIIRVRHAPDSRGAKAVSSLRSPSCFHRPAPGTPA